MKFKSQLFDFVFREWLLIISAFSFLLISIYVNRLPSYSIQEIEILLILFALFVTIKGFENSGLVLKISKIVEGSNFVGLKLILLTFVLSMLVTNDVALIFIVPLTLKINFNKKDMMIILEALAANAGSALTPIGNPQNLFIYWNYNLKPGQFISSIWLFSFVFIFILCLTTFLLKINSDISGQTSSNGINKLSVSYAILFVLVILIVVHAIPVYAISFVFLFVLLFDRISLKIDYLLLLTFFFFFGFAENLKFVLASEIKHSGHVFILSALLSQVISNVPATLIFAKFTSHWKALLWGSNAGGFGSLFGSLANLIAYRLYAANVNNGNIKNFTLKFIGIGYIAFFIGAGLYFFFIV